MKKKIGLLITLIISFIMFVPKTEAVVMWLDCGDISWDDWTMSNGDVTMSTMFALVNAKSTNSENIRYIIRGVEGDDGHYEFATYSKEDGSTGGSLCWYEEHFDKVDKCNKNERLSISKMLDEGFCPKGMVNSSVSDFVNAVDGEFQVLYGTKTASSSKQLNKNIFVIYKITHNDKKYVVAEGYNVEGRYSLVSTLPKKELVSISGVKDEDCDRQLIRFSRNCYDQKFMDWNTATQIWRVRKLKSEYFNILNRDAWVVNINRDENRGTKLYSSADQFGGSEGLGEWAKGWYEEYAEELNVLFDIIDKFETGEHSNLMKVSKEISTAIDEGTAYKGDTEYLMNGFVEDLEKATVDLERLLSDEASFVSYDEKCNPTKEKTTHPSAAALTQFYCDVFNVGDLSALDKTKDYKKNTKIMNEIISGYIGEHIEYLTDSKYNINDIRDKGKEYSKLLAKAAAYVRKSVYFDDEETKKKLDSLAKELEILVKEKFGTEIVVDCESLIGAELLEKINGYLDIVKIAIPIMLIGFGVIDFTKAVFAGDSDKMNKAQKTFFKRIAISILIFLTPTIVNLLLSLANQVWYFIEPGSCGLFETKV